MQKRLPKKRQNAKRGIKLRHIGVGLVASVVLLFAASFVSSVFSGEMFLSEALPHYGFALRDLTTFVLEDEEAETVIAQAVPEPEWQIPAVPVAGLNDVIIQYGTTEYEDLQTAIETTIRTPVAADLAELRDPDVLRRTMYIVDPRTVFVPEMFDVDRFAAEDLRVNPASLAAGAPVVLIFHTHSTEMFVDSDTSDKFNGIVGVGAYLADLLNSMGIGTIHMTQRFDIVDGRSHILGAYERQVPYIRRILEENPTIEVMIDLHRDGLPPGAPKLLTEINGRPTAQIMFFNGLSLRNEGGRPVPINTLPNPYLPYNLAFSFQMQRMAGEMFDNFTRRIYLNAFRYSLHFRPKSLLIEVGAQNNTFQEAINAMYPLAQILANVIR